MMFEEVKQFKDCKVPIGLTLRIVSLSGEDDPNKYQGQTGIITHVDDIGQLHGTWNNLAIIPELDKFVVIDNKHNVVYESEHFND